MSQKKIKEHPHKGWKTAARKSLARTPGFFAGLTSKQKRRALAYRGEESFGDPAFRRPEAQ